ncbi:hypothetical protein Q5P01_004633 [Channa striata]|uniref:Ig-like domain-containing protein n=1 Tax=Channa striata TaxID=64152 RepID=A0AA88NB59_CHASR|nr:hypothetical protein Q5P01_004633 [Channa striata]
MFEFTWIHLSSRLMLVLQFAAAVTGQHAPVFVVRDGDDVTLPCENVINDQNKCDATIWVFSGTGISVELITLGQINKQAKSESDRLSVTEKCSLVIKKVTEEDVGFYTCRQYKGGQELQFCSLYLYVTKMTEHKLDEQVTFTCSVLNFGRCRLSVKWMFEDKNVDKDTETSQASCSDTVTFPTSDLKPNYDELKCKVRDIYTGKEQLFPFRRQSSDMETTTLKKTNESSRDLGTGTTAPSLHNPAWWVFVIAAAGCAALIITVVVVITMWKTKGNKTETKKNAGGTLNSVVILDGPEMGPDLIDAEDDVSYAPISFTKKPSSTAQEQIKHADEDEGDTVTYTTLKMSCSAVAVSTEPSNLYATVTKADK